MVDVIVAACFLVGVVSAVLVAFHPNILYAAVALIFTLLSVAGIYGVLGADFLAAVQLIVYVGGIIIVILFAIMMSENIYKTRFLDGAVKFVVPMLAGILILATSLRAIFQTNWEGVRAVLERPEQTARPIGLALVGPYALVFQYVVVVLLAGLVGAVIIARPNYQEVEGEK